MNFSLILFSLPLFANSLLPKTIIKECYDGDTCTTFDNERIRLACIDTPELKGKNADPVAANKAKRFINDLIANEEVQIRRITKDKYDRTVAELFQNNINIQKLIVEKGYGQIYRKYSYQCEWTNNHQDKLL